MAVYTIAIELGSGASEGQYDLLNTLMSTIGFVRRVQAADGSSYRLPRALYFGRSSDDVGTMRDIARAVTERVGGGMIVFVAETIAWATFAGS